MGLKSRSANRIVIGSAAARSAVAIATRPSRQLVEQLHGVAAAAWPPGLCGAGLQATEALSSTAHAWVKAGGTALPIWRNASLQLPASR